jgi:hypothetical protein
MLVPLPPVQAQVGEVHRVDWSEHWYSCPIASRLLLHNCNAARRLQALGNWWFKNFASLLFGNRSKTYPDGVTIHWKVYLESVANRFSIYIPMGN